MKPKKIPDLTEEQFLTAQKLIDINFRKETVNFSLDSKMGNDSVENDGTAEDFGQGIEMLMEEHAQKHAKVQINQSYTMDTTEFENHRTNI